MKLFTAAFVPQYTPAEAAIVAKYDMVLVAQNTSSTARAWFDSIKTMHPNIKILAYLITNHEPGTALGVGNDILRDVNRWSAVQQEPWLLTSNGDITAIPLDTWKSRRLYDYRKAVWKAGFVDAVQAVMSAYPFDGMFFDNCTASWVKYQPNSAALSTALQSTLLDVRRMYPNKLFIGNGVENWMGLNGEMVEGRPNDVGELLPALGQVVPNMNCYLALTTAGTQDSELQSAYNHVQPTGAWFGVQRMDNVLYWPTLFDTIEG